jgi:hypothetical protein
MLTEKSNSISDKIVYLLLLIVGIIYFIESKNFPGSFQGGDGMRHYLVSRYSWAHPEQFLYLWGKPFFTLVSSPFSQFGLLGIKVFNIICGLISALIVYRITKRLGLKYSILSVIFVLFTPVFYFVTKSGYTEVLFGLIIVFSIDQYMSKKYFFSTILMSFLPFVRSEGYLIIPLFFLVLIYNKKYFHVLLLGAGNVIYSIIGYFYFHDILWLYTQNPYDGHMSEIYGHGPLLHFVTSYAWLWGKPMTVLIVLGLIAAVVRLFENDEDEPFIKEEYILIYGSALVYFISHSVFWWKGLFNSLGLERVMAAVVPVIAIIALHGFNFVLKFIPMKYVQYALVVCTIFFVIRTPYKMDLYPLSLDKEELVVLKLKKWYESSGIKDHHYNIVYLHPFMPEALSFDPFDEKHVTEFWGFYPAIKLWGYSSVADSTLIFWDAHYAYNEAQVPIDTLLHDKHFKMIGSFFPDEPFNVLGNVPFSINVFQKTAPKFEAKDSISTTLFDFENGDNIENAFTLTDKAANSGTRSCQYNDTLEYGAAVVIRANSIKNKNNIQCISLNAKIRSGEMGEAYAILSMHKDDKQVGYYNFPVKIPAGDKWTDVSGRWLIDNEKLQQSDRLKIYLWNKNKNKFYADDFKIDFTSNCSK